MLRTLGKLLAVTAVLVGDTAWQPGLCCSCQRFTTQQVYEAADAVVEGRVIRVDDGYVRQVWCGIVGWFRRKVGADARQCGISLTLAVSERWKGPKSSTVTIETGRGGGDCGLPLEVGESYLLYLYRLDDNRWGTNICMNPTPSDRASEDRSILGELAATDGNR